MKVREVEFVPSYTMCVYYEYNVERRSFIETSGCVK